MPGPIWTDSELERLDELSKQGHGPKAIAAMGIFGDRSVNAIAKARSRAMMVDPTKSFKTRMGLSKRLTGKKRERYIAYLRTDEARMLSSTDIAEKWGVKPRTVREHRKLYDAEPIYREEPETVRERQSTSAYKRHRTRQEVEEVERRTLQIRMEKEGCTLPKVACVDCKDVFFRTETFFPKVRKKRNNGEVRIYLGKRCLTCVSIKQAAKWQHTKKTLRRKKQ